MKAQETTAPGMFSQAFGELGERTKIAGREIVVRFLDLNDLIEIEQRLGNVDAIDQSNMGHLRFLMWLILRKGDPVLSEDDIQNQRYTLTEVAAGSGLTLKIMRSPELADLLRKVLIGSGMLADPNDPDEGSDPNAPPAASV